MKRSLRIQFSVFEDQKIEASFLEISLIKNVSSIADSIVKANLSVEHTYYNNNNKESQHCFEKQEPD